jgi:hypothetical protein
MNSKIKMLGLAVLLLIIFSLIFTAVAYSPYSADTLYPRYSEFEGMSEVEIREKLPKREDFLGINLSTSGFSSIPVANSSPKREDFLGINLSTSGFSSIPVAEGFEQFIPSEILPMPKKPVKVEGFESMLQPANYGKEQTISQFSELNGNLSCINKSAGLSNSMGGLCLDSSLIKALTTRGGNSTGANCPPV